jgi:hypothetical protein
MMRLFTLLLFLIPLGNFAAPVSGPIDDAAELIKNGNVHELAKKFASSIELTILNEENIYSANQAELVLGSFFKNNPVKAVKILHRVNSNPNLRYAILLLTTANAEYRASVSMKLTNGVFLVNEIKIENDKKE